MASDGSMLRFGEESLGIYDELNGEVFDGKLSNKTLFFLALGFGVKNDLRVIQFRRSNTGPRTELTEDDFALITAMQHQVEGENANLTDVAQRNTFAEEFAEGGIRQIAVWLDSVKGDAKVEFLKLLQNNYSE